jgi:hypothetical protein
MICLFFTAEAATASAPADELSFTCHIEAKTIDFHRIDGNFF